MYKCTNIEIRTKIFISSRLLVVYPPRVYLQRGDPPLLPLCTHSGTRRNNFLTVRPTGRSEIKFLPWRGTLRSAFSQPI